MPRRLDSFHVNFDVGLRVCWALVLEFSHFFALLIKTLETRFRKSPDLMKVARLTSVV